VTSGLDALGPPGADLAALVLAAGEGRRLLPLTRLRPKPLCPLGGSTLLDAALDRIEGIVPPGAVAVNAHHLAAQIVDHLAGRAHVSVERPEALGTAGAVGALRPWLAGRDVLIVNGDVCFAGELDLAGFVTGWDRRRPRLLVVPDAARADFDGGSRFAGVSLLPAAIAASLSATPSGLYEVVWRRRLAGDGLDLVATGASYVDCADPTSYLAANLMVSGGESVVGAGATIGGPIERCVIWPGAVVHPGERLVEVIRARDVGGSDLTVAAPQWG
jgi:N-acetyl-alpha-D-muramate 1-phosphate uridylyltransferase